MKKVDQMDEILNYSHFMTLILLMVPRKGILHVFNELCAWNYSTLQLSAFLSL